jgi:hypothetical protein
MAHLVADGHDLGRPQFVPNVCIKVMLPLLAFMRSLSVTDALGVVVVVVRGGDGDDGEWCV